MDSVGEEDIDWVVAPVQGNPNGTVGIVAKVFIPRGYRIMVEGYPDSDDEDAELGELEKAMNRQKASYLVFLRDVDKR